MAVSLAFAFRGMLWCWTAEEIPDAVFARSAQWRPRFWQGLPNDGYRATPGAKADHGIGMMSLA